MIMELRHFDTPLLRFSVQMDTSEPEPEILWVTEENKNLLPLDLELSSKSLSRWLRHRTIPKNRAYVNNLLSKSGLSINRPMSIIHVTKGLSLNDCYWIVDEGFSGRFEQFDLYDNRFSRVLALVAFTGYGSSVRSSLFSSPEFTTNGMLPKCWRRESGVIRLYKGGTSGASNAGNEPYSEFYAWQVAKTMGIRAVEYRLSKWKGQLCSTCELFTGKDRAFLPVGRLVPSGGMKAVRAYYENLGPEYVDALNDMLVFDAIICNVDRHYGNFGFLIDTAVNTIAAPAPLFDHGNSLFNFAAADNLENEKALDAYVETLMPSVYDDFLGTARMVLTEKHREALRRLLTFRFTKHPRYNLPEKRLRLTEKEIQRRARSLLS